MAGSAPRESRFRIEVSDGVRVGAVRTAPAGAQAWVLVYAPGAGSNIDDPFGRFLARVLPQRAIQVVRFQFPYMEAGRRAPDRPAALEATWRAALEAASVPGMRLCAAGRSMGGRIASQVLAQGAKADALALFAYPLHQPGKPEQRRDEHLPAIRVRTLFCSGTRDAFAAPDELLEAASLVKRAKVHLLEGADHGFAVPKATGRTRDDVHAEAAEALVRWLK